MSRQGRRENVRFLPLQTGLRTAVKRGKKVQLEVKENVQNDTFFTFLLFRSETKKC